jgi:hypothetical protein
MADDARDLLRHTLATIAYRGAKALRDAPGSFGQYSAGDSARTPVQILAHIGDLFDWALSLAQGAQRWHDSKPLVWNAEVERFFAAVNNFDAYLGSGQPLHETPAKLFQGPVADALSHVGQIAMLRRLAGTPIRGENYHQAEIVAGRVGSEQVAPKKEF